MFRAIQTRYLGPTNTQGSRVKAIARKREGDMPELSLTDNWDHGSSVEENHARVAKLLAARMAWTGVYVGGANDDGFCFVILPVGPNCADDPETFNPDAQFWGKRDRDYFVIDRPATLTGKGA